MAQADMVKLAKFAHDYRRMIQGNADQLALFTGMRGWTPPRAWIVRGVAVSLVVSPTWSVSSRTMRFPEMRPGRIAGSRPLVKDCHLPG